MSRPPVKGSILHELALITPGILDDRHVIDQDLTAIEQPEA